MQQRMYMQIRQGQAIKLTKTSISGSVVFWVAKVSLFRDKPRLESWRDYREVYRDLAWDGSDFRPVMEVFAFHCPHPHIPLFFTLQPAPSPHPSPIPSPTPLAKMVRLTKHYLLIVTALMVYGCETFKLSLSS
jgi:hypothetical protein